ncbi:hypothetical protein [Chryseobacterium luquanense]|uniref:Uncharacterized protein n=1 Tax=Chryseobacterium luquanense TaxID=2983766 RepID=A0ABT3Y8A5_9FLAO|nr:hypothetical protein [Chryseobacterium luquanense]MCX8534201.1 hypothetical protein [Chryseobacterium luquanense]
MKKFFLSIIICITFGSYNLHSQSKTNNFEYFVRKSTAVGFGNINELKNKWQELKNDTVVYSSYFKGASCDIPQSNSMNMKIVNDSLIFNFGIKKNTDCERRFGSSGIIVDFVINKKKYPNYKDLKIKYIGRN